MVQHYWYTKEGRTWIPIGTYFRMPMNSSVRDESISFHGVVAIWWILDLVRGTRLERLEVEVEEARPRLRRFEVEEARDWGDWRLRRLEVEESTLRRLEVEQVEVEVEEARLFLARARLETCLQIDQSSSMVFFLLQVILIYQFKSENVGK